MVTEPGTSFAGRILIAMPTLADPNFWQAVVLVGVHSAEEGAFGLVINRPLEVELPAILEELGQEAPEVELPVVLSGGPVEPSHGFVLFENPGFEAARGHLQIGGHLALSGDTETLSELVRGEVDGRFYLLLGYSGWAPGQLEREIEENSWLVGPLDTEIVFDTDPEDRWAAALRSIGVEPGTLVDSGSAEPS